MTDTVRTGPAAGTGEPAAPGLTSIDLDVQGMTCASCAARIQKKLNKVEGVQAAVNYATNRAHVLAPAPLDADRLIEVVRAAGYDASLPDPAEDPEAVARAHTEAIRRRLIVSAIIAVPVMLVSMITPLQFPGWQWAALVATTPVLLWGGWGFHRSAWVNLRHGAFTMDTLISVGTLAAYLWSLICLTVGNAGVIGIKHPFSLHLMRADSLDAVYFEAACGTITFILLGRWIEARSRSAAGSALRELLTMGAKLVHVLGDDGTETTRPIEALQVGQLFVVRPGEKVASDGEIVEGNSAIDAHVITGESVPVEVGPGDHVVGATLNSDGRLVVRATAVGADTQLAQIAHLVEQAQTGKSNAQRLADRIASVFVPTVFAIATLTLVGWLIAGAGPSFAITAGVSVLIISCPCALGLATPTALLAGTGRGAQLGVVVRGPQALEQARAIDTVVMDKTGTITTGRMSVQRVVPADGEDAGAVLRAAAALEAGSEHPIAEAIVARAAEAGADESRTDETRADNAGADSTDSSAPDTPAQGSPSLAVEDFQDFRIVPGRGVRARLDGQEALAGNAALMAEQGLAVPGRLTEAAEAASGEGATVVLVAWDGAVRGLVAVADGLAETSTRAVRRFGRLGLRTVMLTGDNERAAAHVARQVGIDEVHAQVLPEEKLSLIDALRAEGHHVAMIGDGVNDAAALAAADLGIAMGTGTDAAIAAGDLTLMRHDLLLAVDAIALSRATLRTIRGNLFWAFFYNVCAIPIAASGLLNPMIAGAAMAFSSVFVVTNSLRLRGFRPAR